MESLRKPTGSYEFILVGFNMASLTMALELVKKQRRFCILDCRHNSHSPFAFLPDANCSIHRGLPFNSALNRVFVQRGDGFCGSPSGGDQPASDFHKRGIPGFFLVSQKKTPKP